MAETDYQKCVCKLCGENIEFPTEIAGAEIDCPHCGQKTELVRQPAFVPPKKNSPRRMLLVGVIFAVCIGTGFFLLRDKPAPTVQKTAEPVDVPQTNSAIVKGISTNDFVIRPPEIQRSGPRLIYAFGMLENLTAKQRFGVRVELDLLDANGEKIGVATDYIPVIEPHQARSYRALVTETKTVTAKFSSVKEDQ